MAYTLPTFNLTCALYTNTGTWSTRGLHRSIEDCNLAYGRRVEIYNAFEGDNSASVFMSLLLPAGTDVRDLKCSAAEDWVEVPTGSNRWYQVTSVDDIGKGFSNEHRCATIFPISEALYPGVVYATLMWPTPIP